MFQSSLGDYVFQAVVLLQPLFWMWFYDSPVWFRERAMQTFFYELSLIMFYLVYDSGFSVGYYTNFLILQYIVFTVLAVYLYSQRFNFKQALSLGFLSVWLNSYYWELPLHLAEYLSFQFYPAMFVQVLRLIPVPFFIKKYRYKQDARAWLSVGLLVSVVIMFFRFYTKIHWWWLYPANRLICLLLLVKVVAESDTINLNIDKE